MLIDFKVKNFLSFGNEETFSMVSGKGRNFSDRIYQNGRNKILKFAALFGPNGSGKSNFVKAVSFSKDYIVRGNNRATIQKYNKINSHCKDSPSMFEYKFSIDGTIYTYGFEILLSKNEVLSEWLYLNNSRIKKTIFKYDGKKDVLTVDEYFKSEELKHRLNIISDSISSKNGSLFLKVVSSYNNLFSEYEEASILRNVFWWFANNLKVKYPDSIISDYAYFMSEQNMDNILEFFKDFDLSISDYKFLECSKEQIALRLPKELFDDLVTRIEKELLEDEDEGCAMFGLNDDFYIAKLVDEHIRFETIQFYHDGADVPFYMSEESDGTKKIFKLLEILFQEDDDIVYVVDEIDRCLHPLLTYNFVNAFLNKASKSNCQMIVTTHESLLLDFNLLRKDEVWLVSKQNGCTLLESMGISNIRADKNLMNDYLLGKKAVPNIKNNVYT